MGKALWLIVFWSVFVWSAVAPHDYFTWFLEVVPALIGFVVLAATHQRFRLTGLVYALVLVHCVILMVGGHYTYAEVPLFDYLRDLVGGERNNYDKLGHFAQGFVPAMIAREIVIRKRIVNGGWWQAFFVVSFCLAFSAFYELIEWWVALASGEGAEAFLGVQGYAWDTQSDMAYALLGAIISVVALRRIHDKQLRRFAT